MKKLSLRRLLKAKQSKPKGDLQEKIEKLQLQMLRLQQGVWHSKARVILVFEGFDAAGKGGAIRAITEHLDPRGFAVHPIGPPAPEEQGRHYLYRFWTKIPAPGHIAIFDRSWYGRLLVERVEKLTSPDRIKDAFREIQEFERTLQDDGVVILKFFLAVSKEEQLRRFEDRLWDPYKHWKIGEADIRARAKWEKYVDAVDDIFANIPGWCLIPGDHKHAARLEVLSHVTVTLARWGKWIEELSDERDRKALEKELKKLNI